MDLKKAGPDRIPYIGVDRDEDGYIDTIPVQCEALGEKNDEATANPTLSGSVISVLKGIWTTLLGFLTHIFLVQLSGSLMDLRGKAVNKPLATAVIIGATYWSVDTDPHGDAIEVSDGTNWVVI